MSDELHKPLGLDAPARKRKRLRPSFPALATASLAGVVLAASFYTAFDPSALITSVQTAPREPAAGTGPDVDARQTATVPTAHGDEFSAAGSSGRRDAIERTAMGDGGVVTTYRPGGAAPDGPQILTGGDSQPLQFAHLPDERVSVATDFGILPERAADGTRPMDVYGKSWSGSRGAKIAIVVGGLGLSQTGTQYAIETLPEEITLAFAASGNSLERWMQSARRGGHEIILQVPFEPFGYPANDPGPATLLVADSPEDTLASLHESMARITNYTGISNYMGGRFLADAGALEPVMREIAERGLLFLDDGSSAQSQAELIARAVEAPFAAAELQLDGERSREAILRQLDALENSAQRNGQAIGIASAFEVSVDAIADWAEEASKRNIEIVGVSALASGTNAY